MCFIHCHVDPTYTETLTQALTLTYNAINSIKSRSIQVYPFHQIAKIGLDLNRPELGWPPPQLDAGEAGEG